MPTYKYKCRECENYFTIKASVKQKEEGIDTKCRKCGGSDVFQTFDSVGIIGAGSKSKDSQKSSCSSCSGNLSCCG